MKKQFGGGFINLKMTTEQGNKLIAEFMEFNINDGFVVTDYNDEFLRDKKGTWEDVKYHSSWDWLMPVVEKIESLSCNVNIINKYCQIIRFEGGAPRFQKSITDSQTKIENTWLAVVEFIKWYNQTKKK